MAKIYEHKKRTRKKDSYSIVFNQEENLYKVTSSGTKLHNLLVDNHEYMEIYSGNISEYYPEFDEKTMNLDMMSETLHKQQDHKVTITKKDFKNELPFGIFKIAQNRYGEVIFKPFKHNIDDSKVMIENNHILEIVRSFVENKDKNVRKNKQNLLLYGAPGNGKSTAIMNLVNVTEELGMRVLLVDPRLDFNYLDGAKEVLEKDTNIFVIEEITERLGRNEIEDILTFFDGENSWNNSMCIATTNYPEKMPENLIDRPGRFETFIEFKNPTKDQIQEIAIKLEIKDDISYLFGKEFSFDYVTFIMSLAIKNECSIKEAYEGEKEKRQKLSLTFKGKMGI